MAVVCGSWPQTRAFGNLEPRIDHITGGAQPRRVLDQDGTEAVARQARMKGLDQWGRRRLAPP